MLSVQPGLKAKTLAPIKNGWYKIINPEDGHALTVTQEGRPKLRHVVTEEWTDAPTQIWKVKNLDDGLQIIRNVEIKDNEISKEEAEAPPEGGEGAKHNFKPTEWNLVDKGEGIYELYNGYSHVCAHGKGERITFEEDCDPLPQWKFEFVKEIEKD